MAIIKLNRFLPHTYMSLSFSRQQLQKNKIIYILKKLGLGFLYEGHYSYCLLSYTVNLGRTLSVMNIKECIHNFKAASSVLPTIEKKSI